MMDTNVYLTKIHNDIPAVKAFALWKEMEIWLRENNIKYSKGHIGWGTGSVPDYLWMSSENAIMFKLTFGI